MKPLLLIMLTATTLFSQAQQTDALVKRETSSSLSMTCIIMIALICLLIAGVAYFLVTNNKRRGINETNNSVKNT